MKLSAAAVGRASWEPRRAWGIFVRSRFGRGVAGRFFLIWLLAKLALMGGARAGGHNLLRFNLLSESIGIGLALFVWTGTVRRRRDDRFLALLGLSFLQLQVAVAGVALVLSTLLGVLLG
ncbi:MAG: hypothetical protein ACHQXA_00195 [Gemmatimonadales bacterium]